jgi:hypothetical protein
MFKGLVAETTSWSSYDISSYLFVVAIVMAIGWLVTVLNQNFKDVGGFMVVLLVILIGFWVSFRLLFASNLIGFNHPSQNRGFGPSSSPQLGDRHLLVDGMQYTMCKEQGERAAINVLAHNIVCCDVVD